MKYFRRPFLIVANLVVLLCGLYVSGAGWFLNYAASSKRDLMPPGEMDNPFPLIKSDARKYVELCEELSVPLAVVGIALVAVGAVSFFVIPWKEINPASKALLNSNGSEG